MRKVWLIFFSLLLVPPALAAEEDYARARAQLIQEIEGDVRRTRSYIGKKELDPKVMKVMGRVPRQDFVPAKLKYAAYYNRPLPIGYGQTISQPYIVALMTDLLEVTPNSRVLEIGTGSGYQSAVLSGLVKNMYTIEIIPPLGEAARQRLKALGYKNVQVKIGDGYYGWKDHAPFDAIIVTAAANHIPPPLLKQLKPGGRMVIPIGSPFSTQQLMLVEKDLQGGIKNRQILPVRFVPFERKK